MRDLNKFKEIVKEEYKPEWEDLDSESLYGFNQITKETSGLPVDIEIDNAKIYEYAKTPLALYFRNSYLKKEEWLPIDYRHPFRALFELKELNITLPDYYKLCSFVDTNLEKLTKLTEGKYGYLSFLKTFEKRYLTENCLVSEMANVPQDITGLKHLLWIDPWVLFGTLENNIRIYKRNKLPVKYFITNDNKTSLFKTEDDQTILFDNITEVDENGKFCLARIGNEKYMVTSSSKLIDLKTIYGNK